MRFVLLAFLLISYPAWANKSEPYPPWELYENSYKKLLDKKFSSAARGFGDLIRKYPYFENSEYAMVLRIYSSYRSEKSEDIPDLSKDFFLLYPNSKYVPYVTYLLGLNYYSKVRNIAWDQKDLKNAKDAFLRLAQLFPDTDYALDGMFRLEFIKSHEASKILDIGIFYQTDSNYAAAISRYNALVWNYSRTIYAREAMYRLVESYISLGLNQEAYKVAMVLGYNFPQSKWYWRSYELLYDRGLIDA